MIESGSTTEEALKQKRALIVKFGQIGDVIMVLPAVHLLHRQGYEIVWVCGKAARPVLECYEWLRIAPVDDYAILRGSFPERVRGVLSFCNKVLWSRYDLCATLYYDRRFHWLTWPVRAGQKLTLSTGSRSRALLAGRHYTDEYERVLLGRQDEYAPQSSGPLKPDTLPPSPLPVTTAARRILLFPGGTSNVLGEQVLRRWPIGNYVQLASTFLERGWQVVLMGGPQDVWVRSHFDGMAVIDRVGSMSLPQVISACGDSDAVVTHDTGPLHLAGLSNAAVVSIFGPTDPAMLMPRRTGVVAIWGGEGFACRPCYDGRNFAPCTFNGCMHQVSPAMVLREVDRLLQARSTGTEQPWKIVSPSNC